MSSAEKWLVGILRFNAILLLCALPPIFFPYAWMNEVHSLLGLGELPRAPIVDYLSRSISALYVGYGVTAWVLATDVRRYRPLIVVWAALSIAYGVLIFFVDWRAAMPLGWTFGESAYTLVLGASIVWLAICQPRAAAT